MTLIVDEVMLREPNLLVPGKKPVGPVKIDWGHSITLDMAASWVPLPSNGAIDLVNNNMPASLIGDGWQAPNGDIGWRTSTDGDELRYSYVKNYSMGGDFTLYWRGYIYGEVAGSMCFMGNLNGAFNPGEWGLISRGDSSLDEILFTIRGDGNTSVIFDTASTWPAIQPGLYTIVVTQKNSGTWKLWNKYPGGLYTETDSDATYLPYTALTQDLVINDRGNGTDTIDAVYLSGGIWNRALSDDEVNSLIYDPYQFLIPA